jgi:hypothetical protein
MPFWQFGDGFNGTARYRNIDRNPTAAAFAPELSTKVAIWGKSVNMTGPYVLPQSERELRIHRAGSYFGILPFSLKDNDTGQVVTSWSFICTGWYALGLLISLVFGAMIAIKMLFFRKKRTKRQLAKVPFDGIRSRK